MPGISSGLANPNDYLVGRGVVYFAEHDPVTSRPLTGYRDLGNCPDFMVSMDAQTLDHFSSRQSIKFLDRQVLISQAMKLSVDLDEVNHDNLALWMSGSTAARSGYNGPAVASPTDNIAPGTTGTGILVGGRWYDLFKTPDPGTNLTTNFFDDRIYDIGTCTIVGGTSPTIDVDFKLDHKMGRIYIIKGGTLDGEDTATVEIAVNAAADSEYEEVRAFTQAPLRGSLKFICLNPSNQNQLLEFEFHKVQLKGQGDFSLISDTWTTMKLVGAAERNPVQSSLSDVCTVRTFPLAQAIIESTL